MEIDEDSLKIEMDLMRNTRNKLLLDTDKYLIIDYPISPENLILIKEYRQKLRDYMNTFRDVCIETEKIPEFPKFPF